MKKIFALITLVILPLMSMAQITIIEDKPEPVLVERLVMSPNGFLASYEAMVNMSQEWKQKYPLVDMYG